MALSYEELKKQAIYACDEWEKANKECVYCYMKIWCIYHAIGVGEPFTLDEAWDEYMEEWDDTKNKSDIDLKKMMREALLDIISDGFLTYDHSKHTYCCSIFI